MVGKPRPIRTFTSNVLDSIKGEKYVVGVRDNRIIIETGLYSDIDVKKSELFKVLVRTNKNEKYFVVTRTCKDDIKSMIHGKEKQIDALSDKEMQYIADKLEDDYVSQMYWDSLYDIVNGVLDDNRIDDYLR